MRVAITTGSIAPIPPVRGNAPNIVVYSTAEHMTLPDFAVFSSWAPELEALDYDRTKYRAVRPGALNRQLVKAISLLPYRWRKRAFQNIFRTTRQDLIRYYLGIAAALRSYRPQVIVAHVSYGLVYWLHAALPRTPIVFYHHGSNMHVRLSPEEWRYLSRCASGGIIAVSQAALRQAEARFGPPTAPTWVIHNGIDPARFHPGVRQAHRREIRQRYGISESAFVFLYAGRISRTKGLENLVSAFSELQRDYPQAQLVIAGSAAMENQPDQAFEQELRQRASASGTAILFSGWTPYEEMPGLIAAADAGVLPALVEEGIPLFLLECMACGVPVIATSMGGIPEIVEHQATGTLINGEEVDAELPAALRRPLEDRAFWQRCAVQAADHVARNHTCSQVAERLQGILYEVNGNR
jgi:spore coat protein SA